MTSVESSEPEAEPAENPTPEAARPESAEVEEPPSDLVVGPFVVLGDADADACGPGGCCST